MQRCALVIAGLVLSCGMVATSFAETLTAAQAAAGWKLLSNGNDTSAWRGYKKDGFPDKGWSMTDGVLKVESKGGGGDLITKQQFGDFEFAVEFKCSAKANSGIIYRCSEAHGAAWQTGPEFQVLDDGGHQPSPDVKHAAGALYDMVAASGEKALKPAGEWNHARVRWSDGLLQHFINGVKVVEVRTDGDAWKDLIAKSKFKDYAGFGMQEKGHISLQDHGDTVEYRNIMVRDLDAPLAGEVALFNGKDLNNWTFFLNDNGKMEDVWEVKDGMIICKGSPAGYIRTKESYKNFVLHLDWRFNPVTKKAGNSGVLMHIQAPDKVWPRSIEAQLQSERAGDFWNIEEMKMTTDASRLKGRNTRHLRANEQPVGLWNHYEIIMNDGTVTLSVNGDVVNSATDIEGLGGFIGLQSEGTEIHFKNVRVVPISGK